MRNNTSMFKIKGRDHGIEKIPKKEIVLDREMCHKMGLLKAKDTNNNELNHNKGITYNKEITHNKGIDNPQEMGLNT